MNVQIWEVTTSELTFHEELLSATQTCTQILLPKEKKAQVHFRWHNEL